MCAPCVVVEAVPAGHPRQRVLHASKGVEEAPGDDEVVVHCHQKRHKDHAVSQPLEGRGNLAEELVWPQPSILADGELQEVEGQTCQGQHHGVGDKEGPSAVPIAEEGKPPHISQSDDTAQAGQEVLDPAVPVPPLRDSLLILIRQVCFGCRRGAGGALSSADHLGVVISGGSFG